MAGRAPVLPPDLPGSAVRRRASSPQQSTHRGSGRMMSCLLSFTTSSTTSRESTGGQPRPRVQLIAAPFWRRPSTRPLRYWRLGAPPPAEGPGRGQPPRLLTGAGWPLLVSHLSTGHVSRARRECRLGEPPALARAEGARMTLTAPARGGAEVAAKWPPRCAWRPHPSARDPSEGALRAPNGRYSRLAPQPRLSAC